MIRVIHTWGTDTPQCYCDHCRQRITTAADGRVAWPYDPQLGIPLDGAVAITHTRCYPAWTRGQDSTVRWAYCGLDAMLHDLCVTLRVNWNSAPMETP